MRERGDKVMKGSGDRGDRAMRIIPAPGPSAPPFIKGGQGGRREVEYLLAPPFIKGGQGGRREVESLLAPPFDQRGAGGICL